MLPDTSRPSRARAGSTSSLPPSLPTITSTHDAFPCTVTNCSSLSDVSFLSSHHRPLSGSYSVDLHCFGRKSIFQFLQSWLCAYEGGAELMKTPDWCFPASFHPFPPKEAMNSAPSSSCPHQCFERFLLPFNI